MCFYQQDLQATHPSNFLSFLIPFLIPPSASKAALDPELKKPYHLRVVLRIAEKPQFTDIFREQIKRRLTPQRALHWRA